MWGQAANAALGQAQRLLTRAGVRADVTVPPAMHEYYEKGKVALEQLSAVPGVKMASSLLATAAANAPSPRIIPRSKRRILALLLPLLLLWMILPYDNIFVLVLRWHGGRMWRGLVETMEGAQAVATDSWLYHDSGSSGGSGISRDGRAAPYPVDMRTDVGVILKTGFGTRKRLDAWFEAFVESGGDSGRFLPEDVMVIADFAVDESNSTVEYKGRKLQIRDAVEIMDASGALPAFQTNDRLWKHKNMTTAIAHGKEGAATMISKEAGWSMDAMKFIPALHLFDKNMPRKKWYILVDDDTYLVKTSLLRLLEHMDYRRPHYIGNAVGDFRARFAHGGSAIVLSVGAMERIWRKGPRLLADQYRASLTEIWGDRLLAMTAMKAGVYLEERYNRYFNGEPPQWARLMPVEHRWCAPIVSFHALSKAEDMIAVGRKMAKLDYKPLRWMDVWQVWGAPDVAKFAEYPVHHNWDHVGGTDERTMTTHGITTAQGCQDVCLRHGRTCMAWTWIEDRSVCNISPWMSVGEMAEGRYSGINVPRARSLMKMCIDP